MAEGGADDRCTDVPRRRWPSGFVGLLGLMLAVEAGLARTERGLEPLTAADWGLDRVAAAREGARSEVLCFGDSLVKTGVAPAALEARLDRPAYNLAALGGPPPSAYFLLRRALDAGARPRAIVVDADAGTLTAADYRGRVREWAGLIGPRDALRLARDDNDPGLFGLHLVHYLVPSVRLRLDVRRAVLGTIGHRETVSWGPVLERQYAINRGAVFRSSTHPKDGPDPFPDGAVPPAEARVCYPKGWSAYPTNLVYLDRFLALARSRGIAVFFVVPPIHPGVQAARERLGLDAAYMAFVRKVREKYGNVVVVDGRHAGYAHGVFADTHHLDLEGATALSRGLADVIAEGLGGPDGGDRWVPLPHIAGATARLAIEDMDESRTALARLASRR